MIFICEDCDYEMDYDEPIDTIIGCEECGGIMYGVE